MKVLVDLNRCQGYGQCVFAAPEAFWMEGGEALYFDYAPDPASADKVVKAAQACPMHAITVDGETLREQGLGEARFEPIGAGR